MDFKELKEELLRRAKEASVGKEGYDMWIRAENKADLSNAIAANEWWVLSTAHIIDTAFLEEHFTEEELHESHIYTKGYHEIFNATAFACGSSTVKACGSSTVKAYGSSTVEAYDSSTVEACDSSTVKACDSSTVKAYDSSTVEAYDSSTVEACDESYVEDCRGGLRPSDGRAIVKDFFAHKLYIKKGAFEIVEVD